MEQKLRIVNEVPGTRIEPSRVDLVGLSPTDRSKTINWLTEAGAVIVSVSDRHVAYYL